MTSMRIREVLIIFSLAMLAVCIVLGITAGKDPQLSRSDDTDPSGCFIKLPAKLEFAGEKVPLQDPEVQERLDRELIINTYYHSSTIQNFKLAGRWFPVIEPVLKKHGVPEDFKYLAVAESGLRNGISPANAVGVWQFLAGTARDYGLTVNEEVDERYEVAKSTEAAAKYLKEAYNKFGSWTLAAASYNMGRAALDSRLSDQGMETYYDLWLNDETSRYVFRIMALKLIMENPLDYGYCFEKDDLYLPLAYKNVEVNAPIPDLTAFAKEHNTNLKTLKYLNPWLRKNSLTVDAGKKYIVRVPQ